jgi:alpha-glucoside transport system substrate-binding protein
MRPRGQVCRVLAPLALLGALLAPAACGSPASATTVTVLGPWTGAEGADFMRVLDAFWHSTGIQPIYTGTRALDQVLQADIDKGTPPDVVILPSPGTLRAYASDGLVPLHLPAGTGGYGPMWQQLTTVHGRQYAVVVTAALKSIIWYAPQAIRQFEPAGWDRQMPAEWNQLMTLTQAITARGQSPWCIGVGSTSESGWPGTDWISDIVLHKFGAGVYQDWANGTLPWTNWKIRWAWQQWAALLAGVHGGSAAAEFTDFGDTGEPMYTSPPGCYLNHEAFIGSYQAFPGKPKPKTGFDYFPFPEMGAPGPTASMVSADLAGTFQDTTGSRALIAYLASDKGQAFWPSLSGADQFSADEHLRPAKDPKVYGDPVRSAIEHTLTGQGTLCFGAGDLMPPALSDAFDQAVLVVLGDPQRYLASPGSLEPVLDELNKVSKQAYGRTPATFRCGK